MKQIIVLCAVFVWIVSSKIVNFSEKSPEESFDDQEQLEAEYPFAKNKGRGKGRGKGNEKGKEIGMNHRGKFKGWMKKYLRNYKPEEQQIRIHYFERNIEMIQNHNSVNKSSYEMAANKFADLSDEQFLSIYLMIQAGRRNMSIKTPKLKEDPQLQHGDSKENETSLRLLQTNDGEIDWREEINFAPIKNQGKCASCYAFSATAVVQLHVALRLRSRRQPTFSQQQIVDCCHAYGYDCNGCTFGYLGPTIQFLADKGLSILQNYPYKAIAQQCKLNSIKTLSYINKANAYASISGEANFLDYILHKGPLAVCLDSTTWKFYNKGEFDGCNFGNVDYNHCITLIGVTKTYWIIRNSWGADWGENGYIRIKRGGDVCGILGSAFYPILIK